MALLKSLERERTRKIFLLFYALSSVLPLLILLYVILQYLIPQLSDKQMEILSRPFQLGLVSMLVIILLGYFLMVRIVTALEQLASTVKEKSSEIVREDDNGLDENEIERLKNYLSSVSDKTEEENEIACLIRHFNIIFQTATETQEEKKRLQVLLSSLIAISSDLTSELEFDRLFPLIIAKITEAMNAERTSLYVVDWENRELWTKVAEQVGQIRVPLGHGISGRVAETGEFLNVRDAWDLPFYDRSYDKKNRFRTKSVLCMPIKNRGGDQIGVLQVINKKDKDAFDEEDEVLLRCLTSQVGNALENSLLVEELLISFDSSISTLSAIVDARHPLTAGHSERVTEYSILIARELGLEEAEIEAIRFAALLHDIGKIAIRDDVLLKNGPFTDEEREEMMTHPLKTKSILDTFHFPRTLREVPEIALYHHEKVDGTGYPFGLTGDQIPAGSKIMAVADVFDALTSRRDYPKYCQGKIFGYDPLPLPDAVGILRANAGKHFDADVVEAFIECLPEAIMCQRDKHFSAEYVDNGIKNMAFEL